MKEIETELTVDERSRLFIETFRKQGRMVDMIIENNKENEAFRTAWIDLINESLYLLLPYLNHS